MSVLKGDEIVISGISGLFPGAENVQQLAEKLYKKIDLVSKPDKYSHMKNPEFPQYMGEVEGMEYFDCQFFRVSSKQAKNMDPVMGKLLENAFSAIFDAGVNPETVTPKLGVYIACAQIDSANFLFCDIKGSSFIISGGSKCMAANRISYWMDEKGPSYSLDAGYAGSMNALEIAYNAMKKGEIECAIVGGSNYCSKPELTLNMKRAGLLCLDGKTKCFDKNGDGFVRSEAINVYFLQKARDAKRIYAEVRHVKGKYFASPDGMFTPKRNPENIENFLKEFYSQINISPNDVEYLEANSFGIADTDENELEAIGNVFAKSRSIKIGSIKSNIGNTECASGASSIIKLCLSYQSGKIPANLHYEEPLNLPALKEQRLQVVTTNEKFCRNFTAINTFCYTGNNFHTLLKGHFKPKDNERYKSSIARLVLVAGRKEESVNHMLDILESNPIDPEQLALLNNFFKYNTSGFTGRGYTLLETDNNGKTISQLRSIEYFSGTTRPVWFLYSGMGSQWAGMGEELLKIPVFAAAITRCSNILAKKDLDLIDILTNKDSKQLNILKSLMAITAIQIGLTDVLKSVGIVPTNILGHSVGEIACAYGDGCLTAEETILTSYARAIATYETKFIQGTMAAVGLGYKEIKHLCPPDIEVACHNSFESATIAGPSEVVKCFVKKLTDRGIFAKEVDSYNIAFHSQYIAEAGPKMLKLLKEVIAKPKPRSNKWLSTCYLPEDWHKPESQYASAEYFAHNLRSSVLLEEAASFIPEDAIIIEIAPHGLLQAIMKRSHAECINIPLTKRGEKEGAKFLLNALGKLHQSGLNIDLESLYPKVEYPVSTETPLLSHFITWDNQIHWKVPDANITNTPITQEFIFSLHDDEYKFLRGYKLDERNVIPEVALLVFTWKTLAAFQEKKFKNTSVVFDNITFYDQISVKIDDVVRFQITIQKGSSEFEVIYHGKIIANGIIYLIENSNKKFDDIEFGENEQRLTGNDVYTLLKMRGYNYESNFRSIKSMNLNRNKAMVKWNKEWVTFLESIIQIKTLSEDYVRLSRVTYINKLIIDTQKHKFRSTTSGAECYKAMLCFDTGNIVSGGVFFKDIVISNISETEVVAHIQSNNNGDKLGKPITKVPISKNGLKLGLKSLMLTANKQYDLESLNWIEVPVISSPNMVKIHYSGLSLKDHFKLNSSDNQSFGMDYSGLDMNGRRVMGLVRCGAMASTVQADSDLLWPVPQHWSLADAATVPLPYVHAFYCLAIRHTLSINDTILVIGAAGALGQAVLSIALHQKCKIFATVGNEYKKQFLLKLFPELDETNIGYTYDASFRAMVAEKTNKIMCNIVINTSSGTIREEAMKCVGDRIFNNAFLDVNDSDQKDNKLFRMGFSDGDKSYKSINMSSIFDDKYKGNKKVLQIMVYEGILKGYVKPLTSVVYPPWEVSRAFKLLSQRRNIGRALVRLQQIESTTHMLESSPRIILHTNKIYIIVCDGSELGIELASLLIQRGAKQLLININLQSMNGYCLVKQTLWKKYGVDVEYNHDDLRIKQNCQKLVNFAKNLGELDGIFITWTNFNTSNRSPDESFENLTLQVSNLDNKIRVCKNLRYFAVIIASSQNCRSEHDMKELEKCCHNRIVLGLPSLLLSHVTGGKIWYSKSLLILFTTLEKSLLKNDVNVFSSSVEYDTQIIDIKERNNTNFEAGFNAFYQHILHDELEAAEPIIPMKTKFCLTGENDLSRDPDNECIILIPGFECNGKTLATVAERLNKPAIVLQADVHLSDNLTTIAEKLLQYVKMRYHLKSPFYLVGHSFGVNIALEIANILEKEGLVGVVYCIDSSPDVLPAQLDAYIGKLSEEHLQNALIEHMYKLFGGNTSKELSNKLTKVETWLEKLELFMSFARSEVQHSKEYLRNFVEASYTKIKLTKMYKPQFTLSSQLVLLKGIPHPNTCNLSTDYNLSSYSKKPVQVFDINCDHAMISNDCRVSTYINRFLERIYFCN